MVNRIGKRVHASTDIRTRTYSNANIHDRNQPTNGAYLRSLLIFFYGNLAFNVYTFIL